MSRIRAFICALFGCARDWPDMESCGRCGSYMDLQAAPRTIGRRVLDRVATALIRRGARTPYFHLVNADGTPYMDRFWLLRIGCAGLDDRGQPRPWLALRLHHIRSSDHGGIFHDHPWSFFSLILRGGYFEHRPFDGPLPAVPDAVPSAIAEEPYSSTWYGAGQLLFRRAEGWHRIALAEDLQAEGTWTLVLTLPPRAHSWGFHIRGQKVEHRAYFRKEAVRQRARQQIQVPNSSDRTP
ncbi:TPA: hypothetical protein ACOEOP_000041 [Stenotrophomonas maltophilia]|uniref:hypothetical protein n=1 Tax=Stenotrophomonas maltophilia TaxID=40324 RepID=UPI00130F9266|nr:hypothetical protein [Stenotrophomonas maltophilia]MDH7617900.1 hypothetical protein [Stenotrophomonas maltophilia]MEA1826476.1 hypothetical protein [Stenotrophomonas maltophilia]